MFDLDMKQGNWSGHGFALFVSISVVVLVNAGCSSALGPEAETEEGFFFSGDTRLSYALDIPVAGSAPFPIVVFGHDSGSNTKNESNITSPARHLAELGVAIFRFDKRGVGNSQGVYKRGYADFDLLSGDLIAAVQYVAKDPRIDAALIGLMGSSQAGWILPIVASRSPHIAFVILRSGPTVTGGQHNYWDEIADDETQTIDALSEMLDAGRKAVQLDVSDAQAHDYYALALHWAGRLAPAMEEAEAAISLNPNYASAYSTLGHILGALGRTNEAVRNLKIALQLDPIDPRNPIRYVNIALSYLIAENFDPAAEWAEKAVQRNAEFAEAHFFRAVALGHLGRATDALNALGECEFLRPGFVAQFPASRPYLDQAVIDNFFDGLRKAGWEG